MPKRKGEGKITATLSKHLSSEEVINYLQQKKDEKEQEMREKVKHKEERAKKKIEMEEEAKQKKVERERKKAEVAKKK